jgi:transcriptional regulator with XRE-family HTH domain
MQVSSSSSHPAGTMKTQKLTDSPTNGSFAERIRLLIQRVGSVTEIARMCGFSEGVVRSWRDGNTDPSRARCVTLAHTLGISLVWLVAGEGTLQVDPSVPTVDEQYSSEKVTPHRSSNRLGSDDHATTMAVDAQRLNTAVRILQSELSLADSQLSLSDNTDLLTQLYEILGPRGSQVDPIAMVTFNHQLAERIHRERSTA